MGISFQGEPQACQQQPMRRESRVAEPKDERRAEHEEQRAEPLQHRPRRGQLHQQRAEHPLQRGRQHQPHPDELKHRRQQRVEQLEEHRGDRNRIGQPHRAAHGPHQMRRRAKRQRPGAGAEEMPAEEVHAEVAAHQPLDVQRVDQRGPERGRHHHRPADPGDRRHERVVPAGRAHAHCVRARHPRRALLPDRRRAVPLVVEANHRPGQVLEVVVPGRTVATRALPPRA